jgi:chromosome partitioning protein
LIEDAAQAVRKHGLEVAPVVVHQRSAFAHALTVGQTAQEFEPGGKAAQETSELFAWLYKLLSM